MNLSVLSLFSFPHFAPHFFLCYFYELLPFFFFFLMIRRPPNSPLFPYTPLSRSERAADIEADHQLRPGRLGPLRRRAREDAERQRQARDATPHDAPPSTVLVLPVWKIGVLWSTWSSDRNGRLKCGLPMMTTTRKLNPLATSCSTGRVSNSIRCWASFLNHSCSALSALIGPRQNSTSAVAAARTAPRPSIAFRPRMASSAGVPNRPNRNHVMPRTPTHPSRSEEHTSELQSQSISYAVF